MNKLQKILLFSLVILSCTNLLPQFKFETIPVFQMLLAITIFISLFINKLSKNTVVTKKYLLYILASVPSLFISLISDDFGGLLVFMYTLFPLLLFLTTYFQIDKNFYWKLLLSLNISIVLIVITGWLLRLSLIPTTFFFDVIPSEFNIGYWGIQYTSSTRNHDYLYPLVGLAVSIYFFNLNKYKLVNLCLILFFIVTLLASLSRGAIIISVVATFYLLKKSTLNNRFIIILFFSLLVLINFNLIKKQYSSAYNTIISSIFETDNHLSQFSNVDRLEILKDGFNAAMINPIGYGIDNYSKIYDSRSVKRISNSAENAFITILIERGWVASFFFLQVFWLLFKQSTLKGVVSLNRYLVFFLLIYFFFNYELNNGFATFIFFIMFLDNYFSAKIKLIK